MAAVHPSREAAAAEAEARERLRALREAQARLRALIDNEPECVKLLDAEGVLLEMNAAGLRMLEADSAEQVLGACVYGMVAPEHAAAFRALTQRVCRGERGMLEFELVGLRGTRRWLETHAVPFHDEASGATRLLAVTRDITDRRKAERAEQALRESEQRFRLFMDNLPATAWIRDSRFRYTYVNPEYARVWGAGRSPESLLGRDARELFPPEVCASFLASDARVREQGTPVQFLDSEPSGRWLKVKFPVPDGDGGMGVAGIAVNVTERSRLEEALQESEQRFRLFMQHLPAAAWIKDPALRYSYVNRTYERVYGRAAREVLGRDDFDLHNAELASFFREEDASILGSLEASQRVHAVPYADGRAGQWLVVKFPLANAAGGTGVGGIAVDITARLEAEARARSYAAEVRDLVKRLVEIQEAERRSVAGELHDLIGQNLTALGIDLQALKQRLEASGEHGVAPRLDAMALLLETTIDAIRGVITELRPAALEEFGLVPALRWYGSQFSRRTGIKVTTRAPRREARLAAGTELTLFRIAQEALTNAAKHSGGSAVEIRLRHGDPVVLTVQDDGSGFAIPEPHGGRAGGFGLTTMRERAEAHGGALRVEFPGRGTRIVVEIPAKAAHHAD